MKRCLIKHSRIAVGKFVEALVGFHVECHATFLTLEAHFVPHLSGEKEEERLIVWNKRVRPFICGERNMRARRKVRRKSNAFDEGPLLVEHRPSK